MNNESKASTSNGAIRPLRDFLYLDFPKLTSFYAQLKEGLPANKTRIKGSEARNLETSDEVTSEGALDGSAGISDTDKVTLTQLLGLKADLEASIRRAVRSGGDQFEDRSADYLLETKTLHHEVFHLIETEAFRRGLVDESLVAMTTSKPICRMTGKAELLDFEWLLTFASNFKDMGAEFAQITGLEDFSTQHGDVALQLSGFLRRFLKDRYGVIITTPTGSITTFLDRAHLTAPFQHITENYGRTTKVPITLFGIRMQPPNIGALPNTKVKGEMANAIVALNRNMQEVENHFHIRGDLHVYPIAIFLDL
jgi:hypothetical protein